MKTSILYLTMITCLLTVGCKKNKDENGSSLRATIDGVDLKLNSVAVQKVSGVYYNNLLEVRAPIDGSSLKGFTVYVATENVKTGEVIDFRKDDGRVLLNYSPDGSAMYGAGKGWEGSSGTITITTNDPAKGKLEGTFNGTLINGDNIAKKVNCTNGKFSVTY
jgi:hypothetical protein